MWVIDFTPKERENITHEDPILMDFEDYYLFSYEYLDYDENNTG